jgi:oxygen-independent coproporphyrinogen-3 oxidase
LADLSPILKVVSAEEFTVEMHPLDATEDNLQKLKDNGVNRISMGLQSLHDETLDSMKRGYNLKRASQAFERIKKHFKNAGVDIIVGYPDDETNTLSTLSSWGITHISLYALQNERNLRNVPSDEIILDKICKYEAELKDFGILRYEISNYAKPGYECRHNMAVWCGEDYIGLGEGAFGRIGLDRTVSFGTEKFKKNTVSEEEDKTERLIFRLRTKLGLEAGTNEKWHQVLERAVLEGFLYRKNKTYFLTDRGKEVCDSILSELI